MTRLPDLELERQPDPARYTWAHFLHDVADRYGERCAMRCGPEEWSFDELRSQSLELAAALAQAGVVKGARVAVHMANRSEWVVASFAVALCGGVLVPVNTFATIAEREYILRHSDASVLLFQRTLLNNEFYADLTTHYPEIATGEPGALRCARLPFLRRAVCLGLEAGGGGIEPWSDFLARGAAFPPDLLAAMTAEVKPSDDGLIIYTSGTTSHPKGVLHMQRAPAIQSWRFAQDMGLGTDDVVWTAQPFFWTAGICMSLGASLAAGATLILQETFDAEAALDALERERVTAAFAWPHQDKAMAEHPSAAQRDLSTLRKVEFGSPLGSLVGLEKDEWGTYGSYGMSETFTICSSLPASAPAERRAKTNGLALPGMSLRIVSEDGGEVLGAGEPGEIAVKGVTFMRGYYKVEPELYLDDAGYYYTQDGGSIDGEGYLHWTGRLSNLIKTGGANVSPLEIDAALESYPGMRLGMAVGVPHPVLGEVIVLCAVALPGAELDESEVRAFLRSRLAVYKVPKRVLIFADSDLHYTGTQKVQSAPLRDAALARLQAEDAEIDGVRYGASG